MKFITLGNRPVPAIGLGTYKLTGREAIDIISYAISIGYRHIDTAQLYENEKEVGQAIIKSDVARDDIYLVTKVWPSNLHVDRFIPSFNESLRKLKTDYVDLLLIHWPHHYTPLETYIPLLIQAKESGLAKDIGVSNFNITQLRTTIDAGAQIVTNQVEFHPWINQARLHHWMSQHHLPLTAYSPLGQGRLLNSKNLENLAAIYARTPAQIILRWMMQLPEILAIPRSSNKNRLAENLNIFDFSIADDHMQLINSWQLENHRIVGAQNGAKWD